MAEVRIVTRDDMLAELMKRLENEPITFEEFVEEGNDDTLTDGYHRDLWLYYRDWILNP